MYKKSELEKLKDENKKLKEELEMAELRAENRELRRKIDEANTITYPYVPNPYKSPFIREDRLIYTDMTSIGDVILC